MKRDNILRMAREAGLLLRNDEKDGYIRDGVHTEGLERFAALVAASARRPTQETELMAECMGMVHQDLIGLGVIDKGVPPMMVPEAVCNALMKAVKMEREQCALAAETAPWINGEAISSNAAIAAAIRARGMA